MSLLRTHRALLTAALLAAALPLGAQDAPLEKPAEDAPDIVGEEISLEHNRYAAGASVALSEPVSGSAWLAGGLVQINASAVGSVTAAGGEIDVGAAVGNALYAAGGRVTVDARVNGNARLAGAEVRIAPESRIEGAVTVAAGTVRLAGYYGGDLTVVGADVTLGGTVVGDVSVYANTLTVLPGTRIGGRLSYRTSGSVALPDNLDVYGGVEEDGSPDPQEWIPQMTRASTDGASWVGIAGLVAAGALLAYVLAGFSRRTTRALTARPWAGIGLGLLALSAIPVLAVALFVTLIGIPLALIVILLYLLLLAVAYVVGALFFGDRALAAARPHAPPSAAWRLVALVVVLVALALLDAVPFVGGVVQLVVLLLGLGGIVLAFARSEPRDLAHP